MQLLHIIMSSPEIMCIKGTTKSALFQSSHSKPCVHKMCSETSTTTLLMHHGAAERLTLSISKTYDCVHLLKVVITLMHTNFVC